jgi:ubiquinone/menaquinone biosynthesis C-methylase UbiE
LWTSSIQNREEVRNSGPYKSKQKPLQGGITEVLTRVLEPEVMDRPDEAREYDAMDHSDVITRFVADFLAAHGPGRGGEMLDVGTGPARIPIALCRADRHFRILGVDLAGPMLDLARRNAAEAGLTDRIRFARGDAKTLPFPDGRFEAVVSNTIVHHIPNPALALAEMVRLVAPGGTLMVRDLARPKDEAAVAALVELHARSEPIAARNMFRDSLIAALTLEEVRAILLDLGMSSEGVALTSDRHWTWIWSRPSR